MKIIPASDSSLLVVFGDTISPEMQECVLGLFHALQAMQDSRIRNLHPGYASLLVDFDPLAVTHEELVSVVESLAGNGILQSHKASPLSKIPVCYDAEFGPDLPDVAAHARLPIDEVIRLHAGATYRVCFLGFTAGFAYLGGLPEVLHTPRLATPRRAVTLGQRWDCGRTDRHLSHGDARRLEADRAHAAAHVRSARAAANASASRRPGAFPSIDRATFERLWQGRA